MNVREDAKEVITTHGSYTEQAMPCEDVGLEAKIMERTNKTGKDVGHQKVPEMFPEVAKPPNARQLLNLPVPTILRPFGLSAHPAVIPSDSRKELRKARRSFIARICQCRSGGFDRKSPSVNRLNSDENKTIVRVESRYRTNS